MLNLNVPFKFKRVYGILSIFGFNASKSAQTFPVRFGSDIKSFVLQINKHKIWQNVSKLKIILALNC